MLAWDLDVPKKHFEDLPVDFDILRWTYLEFDMFTALFHPDSSRSSHGEL